MWHVATDVAWSVFISVCLLDTTTSCAKTAESVEMPFGLYTRVGPRNHTLDVLDSYIFSHDCTVKMYRRVVVTFH